MRNKRTVFSDFSGRIIGTLMLAAVALVLTVSLSARAYGADENGALLAGTVKSDSGEKMSGVTISAKAEGRTITTSVFTDQQGDYYFPPLAPGEYEVWAQADTFETARAKVNLTATRHQDFALKHLKDFQRQLTGDQLLASLPDGTPDDRRLARIFRNSCTSCHQPNYILQERFDTAGWTSILDLMKRVTVAGGYLGEKSEAAPIIDFHEKELATYLARISGPGPTAMKFKLRPRPTGEAARAVFTEYDVPIAPDEKAGTEYISNDGSDWSLGTPSSLSGAHGIHDAQADLQGNIWFSYNVSNHDISLGRVDAKTGALKTFKIAGLHGYAANGHGLARDRQGILWFNMSAGVEGGQGRLAKIDPATEQIKVFTVPEGMTGPTAAAGTVDVDGKGKIWATTGPGAVRFDPETEKFTEFKSPIYKNADGIGNTYGLAADGDGNGWWAQMNMDTMSKSDIKSGRVTQVKIPPVASEMDLVTPEERKVYADAGSTWTTAVPWAEGPRRLGADKNGHVVWVCDWWGGSLAKIDTHTLKVTMIPLPKPDALQPYQAQVDSNHNVWINLMNADEVVKFDPKTSKWVEYPFPTLGAETRYVSLLEKDGGIQVILPYSRARKVARMTIRSEKELESLKAQAERREQARAR
jgi:streptogramin lyase